MQQFDLLVSYDIETTTRAGQRRMRKICKLCKNYGQRVQYSIYACTVNRAQFEQLEAALLDVLDPNLDSLHLYTLPGGRNQCVRTYGLDTYLDFEDTLIV